ncbi:hypothetical protein HGG75_13585 [Ochrobactrum pseudogrignonense]|nr:hypothetical protein [Brucella pseudogrignonensis]
MKGQPVTTEAGQDRAIDRVEGKLDQIIKDMDRARDDRKQQYEKQEKTDRTLDEVMRKLQSVDNRLEKVEEPVADFNRWRERGVGAIMLVSFVAASLGGMFVTFGKDMGGNRRVKRTDLLLPIVTRLTPKTYNQNLYLIPDLI